VNLLTDMFPALAVALAAGRDRGSAAPVDSALVTSLARTVAIRGTTTALGATLAWTIGRYTGRGRRADSMGLVALVGTQLGQTLLTDWRSPLVVATTLASAAVLLAIVETLADTIDSRPPGVERPFPDRPTVMEFGCGLGRLLRHAPGTSLARMIATDVNGASLTWCRTHLPEVEYHLHGHRPPIGSLPANSVDLIYAHSVFTHIPLERHLEWLRELERVLRPGGWAALTVLGHAQQEPFLDASARVSLTADGAIQVGPEYSQESDSPVSYHAVCQTVAHQEATVGSVFEIGGRRVRASRQDVLALYKVVSP